MARINVGAALVGTIQFTNGNRTTLHYGFNSNTGEPIVWQACNDGRPSRITGRNIARLVEELEHVLDEGEARWLEKNDEDIDRLIGFGRSA
jgi:hypothetical protein